MLRTVKFKISPLNLLLLGKLLTDFDETKTVLLSILCSFQEMVAAGHWKKNPGCTKSIVSRGNGKEDKTVCKYFPSKFQLVATFLYFPTLKNKYSE